MSLLSPVISNFLALGCPRPNYSKLAATLMAILFLSVGFVLGAIGLYHYFLPQWGKAITLLGIGAVCLTMSSLFFTIRYFLKPKPFSWKDTVSVLENNLAESTKQLVSGEGVVRMLRPYVSLKSLGTLFVLAVIMSSYLGNSKKG